MKITITGGSGFIGNHIASLLEKNNEITILDHKKSKIENATSILGSITDKEKINQSVKDAEVVIHLAAVVGVKITETNPILTLDTNVIGTKNILNACVENEVKKIIFASSSEIYGEATNIPISELEPLIPITNYGVSKIVGEEYVQAYSAEHGLKYSILRFFNAFGPGQSKDFVISEFLNNAINNNPIIIHGFGKQIRAFCHINDIVQGIELCLKNGDNEIFNIGNDKEPMSIKDLAERIIKLTDSKSKIQFVSFSKSERNRKKEIFRRIPDIEKAKKILGYEPRITFDDGLKSILSNWI